MGETEKQSHPQGREAPLQRADWGWLTGAILAGGVIAPVLLMLGLARTSGSAAALLLNLEGVFTALLAWFVLAGAMGWQPGALVPVIAALFLGFLGYGVSLSLFVWALRHLGTAR